MPPWIDVPQVPGAHRAAKTRTREARPGFEFRNAADPSEAEMLIYDEISDWWGVSASDVIGELAQVTAPNLRVRINSPGGDVFEGLAIANALRSHPANVTVQVDGLAASIASVIAMAGDQVVMMPNSMLMIHEAAGVCFGDAGDMQQMADVLSKISDNIADVYAAKAGGTRDEWRATMQAETWYLPQDAVAAGLADEAVDAKPASAPDEPDGDEPAMHARWDLTVYGYAGPKAPEKPKPGPAPTLLIRVEDVLAEETVAALRAAVRDRGAEAAAAEFGGAVTAVPADVPAGPAAPAEPAEPDVTPDPWAASVARLTAPDPNSWAAATKHLITGPASSSATES
jgi:ATP-dependent protease ClpP protease subunit